MTIARTQRKKASQRGPKFVQQGSVHCNAGRQHSKTAGDAFTLEGSCSEAEIHSFAKTSPPLENSNTHSSLPVEKKAIFLKKGKKGWRKAWGLLFVLAILLFLVQDKTQLIIAASPSLPWRVYLLVKGMSWQRGDLVTIRGHSSPYIQGTPLITKRVTGLVGETIQCQGTELYMNDKRIASLVQHNSKKQPLRPIKKIKIPVGYVFVMGDDPQSFDSRYEEFGLVKVDHILGRSFPLW